MPFLPIALTLASAAVSAAQLVMEAGLTPAAFRIVGL